MKKPIYLDLDKRREFKLTIGAMKRFKKETGKSLFKSWETGDFDEDDFSVLIWACLVHEDKSLTIEQVDEMVSLVDLAKISAVMEEAVTPETGGKMPGKKWKGIKPKQKKNG